MLPQNYQVRSNRSEDEDDDNEGIVRGRHRGLPGSASPSSFPGRMPATSSRTSSAATGAAPSQPPLGVTGVLCDTHSLLIRGRGTLQYTVFRPRYVRMKPPLVCLAGGPYLPWQYLSTLVHLVNDRSLVFFDPIGCGQSKRMEEKHHEEKTVDKSSNKNPVPDMVHDLVHLVHHLHLEHYHLYGHSFGGIIAYEALASKEMPGKCLSLILSSTPANLPKALHEIDQLKAALTPEAQSSLEDPDHALAHLFAERHECRVRPLPLQLQQSFAMAGFSSSPAGWQVVRDYVVDVPNTTENDDDNEKKLQLPLLLLRGEFDFISEACMEPWRDCIVAPSCGAETSLQGIVTLPGVAHYGMLEDEEGYGVTLRNFLASVPEPALQIPVRAPSSSSSSSSSQRRSRLPH